ncbi:MAG: hypothetical protein AAGM38_04870 [Pseudomonadota bacterium]
MPTPAPWSIKGIPPEARAAAKEAARREGVTLGAWLVRKIEQDALDAAGPDASATLTAPSETAGDGPGPVQAGGAGSEAAATPPTNGAATSGAATSEAATSAGAAPGPADASVAGAMQMMAAMMSRNVGGFDASSEAVASVTARIDALSEVVTALSTTVTDSLRTVERSAHRVEENDQALRHGLTEIDTAREEAALAVKTSAALAERMASSLAGLAFPGEDIKHEIETSVDQRFASLHMLVERMEAETRQRLDDLAAEIRASAASAAAPAPPVEAAAPAPESDASAPPLEAPQPVRPADADLDIQPLQASELRSRIRGALRDGPASAAAATAAATSTAAAASQASPAPLTDQASAEPQPGDAAAQDERGGARWEREWAAAIDASEPDRLAQEWEALGRQPKGGETTAAKAPLTDPLIDSLVETRGAPFTTLDPEARAAGRAAPGASELSLETASFDEAAFDDAAPEPWGFDAVAPPVVTDATDAKAPEADPFELGEWEIAADPLLDDRDAASAIASAEAIAWDAASELATGFEPETHAGEASDQPFASRASETARSGAPEEGAGAHRGEGATASSQDAASQPLDGASKRVVLDARGARSDPEAPTHLEGDGGAARAEPPAGERASEPAWREAIMLAAKDETAPPLDHPRAAAIDAARQGMPEPLLASRDEADAQNSGLAGAVSRMLSARLPWRRKATEPLEARLALGAPAAERDDDEIAGALHSAPLEASTQAETAAAPGADSPRAAAETAPPQQAAGETVAPAPEASSETTRRAETFRLVTTEIEPHARADGDAHDPAAPAPAHREDADTAPRRTSALEFAEGFEPQTTSEMSSGAGSPASAETAEDPALTADLWDRQLDALAFEAQDPRERAWADAHADVDASALDALEMEGFEAEELKAEELQSEERRAAALDPKGREIEGPKIEALAIDAAGDWPPVIDPSFAPPPAGAPLEIPTTTPAAEPLERPKSERSAAAAAQSSGAIELSGGEAPFGDAAQEPERAAHESDAAAAHAPDAVAGAALSEPPAPQRPQAPTPQNAPAGAEASPEASSTQHIGASTRPRPFTGVFIDLDLIGPDAARRVYGGGAAGSAVRFPYPVASPLPFEPAPNANAGPRRSHAPHAEIETDRGGERLEDALGLGPEPIRPRAAPKPGLHSETEAPEPALQGAPHWDDLSAPIEPAPTAPLANDMSAQVARTLAATRADLETTAHDNAASAPGGPPVWTVETDPLADYETRGSMLQDERGAVRYNAALSFAVMGVSAIVAVAAFYRIAG